MFRKESPYNEIDLDFCDNGYSVNELDCFDQAIATASTLYNKENYFLYAFILKLKFLWIEPLNHNYNFFNYQNEILNKLGLELIEEYISDEFKLIPTIKNIINNYMPVIYMPKRNAIPYSSDYQNNIDSLHAILISGYAKLNNVLVLRDISHLESSGAKIQSKYGLYKLYLKESIFVDMYNDTNFYVSKSDRYSYFENKLFYIQKTNDNDIKNYQDLITYFNSMNLERSNLYKIILNLKNDIQKQNLDFSYWIQSTKFPILQLINSFTVFIDILEKTGKINSLEKEKLQESFSNIYNNILIIIKKIVSKKIPTNIDLTLNLINDFESLIINCFK